MVAQPEKELKNGTQKRMLSVSVVQQTHSACFIRKKCFTFIRKHWRSQGVGKKGAAGPRPIEMQPVTTKRQKNLLLLQFVLAFFAYNSD